MDFQLTNAGQNFEIGTATEQQTYTFDPNNYSLGDSFNELPFSYLGAVGPDRGLIPQPPFPGVFEIRNDNDGRGNYLAVNSSGGNYYLFAFDPAGAVEDAEISTSIHFRQKGGVRELICSRIVLTSEAYSIIGTKNAQEVWTWDHEGTQSRIFTSNAGDNFGQYKLRATGTDPATVALTQFDGSGNEVVTTDTTSLPAFQQAGYVGLQLRGDNPFKVFAFNVGVNGADAPVAPASTTSAVAVRLDPPTGVTKTSMTLNGALTELEYEDSATLSFWYRETGTSSWTTTSPTDFTSVGPHSEAVSGLDASTTYDIQLYATVGGLSRTSGIQQFSTNNEYTFAGNAAPSGTLVEILDGSTVLASTIESGGTWSTSFDMEPSGLPGSVTVRASADVHVSEEQVISLDPEVTTYTGINFSLVYVPTEGTTPDVTPTGVEAGGYTIQEVQLMFWNTTTPIASAATQAPWTGTVLEELEAGTLTLGWRVKATSGGGDVYEFTIGPYEVEVVLSTIGPTAEYEFEDVT